MKDIDKDLQKFREIFAKHNFSDREFKELKNHFDEMAGFFVDVWLERKKSFTKANKKHVRRIKKPN